MRTAVNHTPPETTQPEPPDNTSMYVLRQVNIWLGFHQPRAGLFIHTQSAMEIAAWWQAPGNAFSAFSHTGTILDDLADEIAAEIHAYASADEHVGMSVAERQSNATALRALDAYVRACTLPVVWSVGHNIAGYLPEAEVQTFISYADAVEAFRDMVTRAPDEMTGESDGGDCSADGPCEITSETAESGCVVDSGARCEYHDLDAQVSAYLVDEAPTGAPGAHAEPREALLYLRPDSVPLPTAYWLTLVTDTLTYGDYLAEREV